MTVKFSEASVHSRKLNVTINSQPQFSGALSCLLVINVGSNKDVFFNKCQFNQKKMEYSKILAPIT